jgi:hypothetical protein
MSAPSGVAQNAPSSPSLKDRLNGMMENGASAWTPEQLTVMARLRDAALKDPTR